MDGEGTLAIMFYNTKSIPRAVSISAATYSLFSSAM
jgi:hypothetical protein